MVYISAINTHYIESEIFFQKIECSICLLIIKLTVSVRLEISNSPLLSHFCCFKHATKNKLQKYMWPSCHLSKSFRSIKLYGKLTSWKNSILKAPIETSFQTESYDRHKSSIKVITHWTSWVLEKNWNPNIVPFFHKPKLELGRSLMQLKITSYETCRDI